MIKYDFLVLGSGIAGLVYAIEVSKHGKVAVISKNKLSDCNTDYAQGGIAAVLNDHDSFENHIQDTYKAGVELGKIPVIEKIVKGGPEAIQFLLRIGTKFTKKETTRNNQNAEGLLSENDRSFESLSLTREGGHSQERVAYAADSTGHEIMQALIKTCKENKNIDIYENHIAVDLITQHHILQNEGFIPRITCWGAYVLNIEENKIIAYVANKTMLSTGGAGQVYQHNTNSEIATGDGIAMARLAGARVANMEFIQFHPTAFYSPDKKTFLVTEALRGEGAILRLQDGSSFMEKYHELGNLSPRDVVSRAIDFELKIRDERYVYLDATNVDHHKLKTHFPYIDKKCQKMGIDFTKDFIPVAPAAHYFCGGVLTTIDGETDIQNLFASGEVACTGFHGANRLASNSLLEAVVTSLRAANHQSNLDKIVFPSIPKWRQVGSFNENEWVVIAHNREIMKHTMQNYVGISRSRRLLKYAQNRLDIMYREIDNFYHHNNVRKEVVETRNMAIVAKLIIKSALIRKESRGLQYLVEYPEKNDEFYKKDTII
ncbi:MAG: L-aspartate oxidase [Candidatus Cloacimonetes bacterium]|nr:L-aspartate oxidase [Candidatus Cloacimonadota bacterium]